MAAQPKIMSGPMAAQAAEQLRRKREQENAWPYEHIFPPPDSIPVNAIYYSATYPGFIPVPVAATPTIVAYYQVPEGCRFVMQGILQSFNGTMLPGDMLWTVYRNRGGGVQAMPVQGLISVPVPLGSWENGVEWFFQRAYDFEPFDAVTSVVTNVNLTPGSPNFCTSGFFGYLLPTEGL